MCNEHEYEVVEKQFYAYTSRSGEPSKVLVTDTDFDKRIYVEHISTGEKEWIKGGYVFYTKEDCLEASLCFAGITDYSGCPSCIDPRKNLLSNKNYALWKKYRRKTKKKNIYFVITDDETKNFKFFNKALMYFSENLENYCGVFNDRGDIISYEKESDTLFMNSTRIKSRHVGKSDTYKQWRKC